LLVVEHDFMPGCTVRISSTIENSLRGISAIALSSCSFWAVLRVA